MPPLIRAGVILSVWNPDASWERDDMLRVVATMGVPTQVRAGVLRMLWCAVGATWVIAARSVDLC